MTDEHTLQYVTSLRCSRKVSLPADRKWVSKNMPILMTKLEIAMPTIWNTFVVHLFVFHTTAILEAAGPYCECNMLDVERYHTLFKSFARGTNVMASIKTNYELLEASQQNRMVEDMEWTTTPRRSTAAGLAARADSANKKDRCVEPKGASKEWELSPADLLQMQDLWAIENAGYDRFRDRFASYNRNRSVQSRIAHIADWVESRKDHFSDEEKLWQTMSPNITRYERVEYGGNTFGTTKSQKKNKHDNSHIRVDYNEPVGRNNIRRATAYAEITDLFLHTMYPGGPSKMVVCGSWLEDMGRCPTAGTTLVRYNRNHPFNLSAKFTFIQECYPMPVALWPYDPFGKLPNDDPHRKYYDIIDRNQLDIV